MTTIIFINIKHGDETVRMRKEMDCMLPIIPDKIDSHSVTESSFSTSKNMLRVWLRDVSVDSSDEVDLERSMLFRVGYKVI